MSDSEKLDLILEKMDKVEQMVNSVLNEVKPTLDSLMTHPMFKMFMKGSK